MDLLKRLLKYLSPFGKNIAAIVVANILYAFFSLFSFTMIAPFLSVLFGHAEQMAAKPDFAFNLNAIIGTFPALYPAFEEETGDIQRAVLERGVKVTGATAYFADQDGRVGGIILQKAVDVLPGDDPESLRRRVTEEAEWKLLSQAVALYCAGKLKIHGKRVVIDN